LTGRLIPQLELLKYTFSLEKAFSEIIQTSHRSHAARRKSGRNAPPALLRTKLHATVPAENPSRSASVETLLY
jgi:hypothetical protein